jgi:hypothetical protein
MGVEDENQTKGLSVEYAASTIVKALIRRETELLMAPFMLRIAIGLRYFCPNFLFWMLHKRGQNDPHQSSKKDH